MGAFPRRFGPRYVLLKQLGRGGMGEVSMAVTGEAGVSRVCALKIVRRFERGRDADEMSRRFGDEARVVTQLAHESLVYVFDFGIVDGQGYLAMEYVAGKTLMELWNRCAQRREGIPTAVSTFVTSELAAALGYAHRLGGLGLIHRDISPSNLMITYTGGTKLIDFGLAQWQAKASLTATGVNWGKVNYMSPEQREGRPIDYRSDLFAMGVILWELLTGRQLFPDPQSWAPGRELPPPSQFSTAVPPGLERAVMKALARKPEDRFASGEEMSAAIAAEMPREAGRLMIAQVMDALFGADRRAEETELEALLAQAAVCDARQASGGSADGDATIEANVAYRHGNPGRVPIPSRDELRSAKPSSAARDPLIGAVLAERYVVKRLIGEGGMGRVYEGLHTGLARRVAIKVPRGAEGTSLRKVELLGRFRREAQAASQIGHPNIADVTDCGETPAGDFFFVMEFVDGVGLDELVRSEGTLPPERVLLVAIQIARALDAAHRAGVVHRDLKPSNVMVARGREEAEVVKVLDFGLAKFLGAAAAAGGDITRAEGGVGTPRYMAPEQVGTGAPVDERADVYALGGVLYFMLSGGRAPVEGESAYTVWHRKLHEEPTPLARHRADLPPALETLVMRCLARDPAARPQAMAALKRDLVAALERLQTTGRPFVRVAVRARPRSALAFGPWAQRAVFAGALVLAAAAGSAAWRARNESRTPPVRRSVAARLAAPPAQKVAPVPTAPPSAAYPPAAAALPPPAPSMTRPDAAPSLSVAILPAPSSRSMDAYPTTPASSAPAQPPTHTRTATPRSPPSAAFASAPVDIADRLLSEADALFQKGQLVAALTAAEKARRAGAGVAALLLEGKIHLEAEEPRRAGDAFLEATQREPDNQAAWRGLARAQALLDKKPRGLQPVRSDRTP